jgi:hypothetical protein
MVLVHYMLDNVGLDTHSEYVILVAYMAALVTEMHVSVTLYINCLSGYICFSWRCRRRIFS